MGKSHINIVRDGQRFLIVIFRVATLFSLLKVLAPVSATFFLLGFGYYTFTTAGHLPI